MFKPMKRADLLKALEGQENVLAPAVAENERFFRAIFCPSCGGDVMPIVNTRKLFREGGLLPNFLGKCKTCHTEFEPHTNIIISLPKDD
jgi:hypothetical protein